MANYNATTVSRGGQLKKGFDMVEDKAKLLEIISKYSFGDSQGELEVTVDTVKKEIGIWGDSACFAYLKEDEDMDNEVFDEFLKEVCPFLSEPLIVSEVGNEKCRYVGAYAYIAFPDGRVVSVSLDTAIDEALLKDGVNEISVSKNNKNK